MGLQLLLRVSDDGFGLGGACSIDVTHDGFIRRSTTASPSASGWTGCIIPRPIAIISTTARPGTPVSREYRRTSFKSPSSCSGTSTWPGTGASSASPGSISGTEHPGTAPVTTPRATSCLLVLERRHRPGVLDWQPLPLQRFNRPDAPPRLSRPVDLRRVVHAVGPGRWWPTARASAASPALALQGRRAVGLGETLPHTRLDPLHKTGSQACSRSRCSARQLEHRILHSARDGVGAAPWSARSTCRRRTRRSPCRKSARRPRNPRSTCNPRGSAGCPAQMGVAPPQSSLLTHWTHSPVASQTDRARSPRSRCSRGRPRRSRSARRTRRRARRNQSFVRHSAHAPVVASHFEALRGQAVGVVPVHDAWHW